MAEVLPSPAHIANESSQHEATVEPGARSRPRSHFSSSTSTRSARLSTLSRHTSAQSRPHSMTLPVFSSSLTPATVRDFAYPGFHPLHYGPPPEPLSGTTTPGSEWASYSSSRRLSDPPDAWNNSRGGNWGAGPWGGDGVMYTDPASGDDGEALPSTSFGEELDDDGGGGGGGGSSGSGGGFGPRQGKHRKSKSYTDFSDMDRGRRQELNRRSRGSADGGSDFHTCSKLDPAGQDSLRQSRNYGSSGKRNTGTLPSRSFHTGQLPEPENDEDLLPLDAEQSLHNTLSPQRASMGPEDEELYAGESLALYSFEPENANELRLREGQIILVSYRHGQGWLVAEDPETGEQGLVPEEYVRLVREIETWDPERGGFIEDDSMDVDEQHDVEADAETEAETESEEAEETEHDSKASPDDSEMETSQELSDHDHDHESDVHDITDNTKDVLEEGRQDSAHGDESKP